MLSKSNITVGQLFIMLFISRMIINLTYTPILAFDGSIWNYLISAVISFFLTLVLLIPVYKLYKLNPSMNIADNVYSLFGKLGIAIIFIYAIYYLVVCCYTISLFDIFVSNAMSPNISMIVLSLCVVIASCYGAFKGIKALGRASIIVLVLICIVVIFIIIALSSKVRFINFTPFFSLDKKQAKTGILLMISRTSCIPAMAMLLPFVKGNVKKGMLFWNISVYGVIIAFIILMVGSLGYYLNTQIFPVYTATTIAELGILKRLDSFYLGVWITGLLIKIALFLYLFSLCIKKVFKGRLRKLSILVGGFLVFVFSIIIVNFKEIGIYVYNLYFLLIFTLLTAFVIPLVVLLVNKIKIYRESVKIEKV